MSKQYSFIVVDPHGAFFCDQNGKVVKKIFSVNAEQEVALGMVSAMLTGRQDGFKQTANPMTPPPELPYYFGEPSVVPDDAPDPFITADDDDEEETDELVPA